MALERKYERDIDILLAEEFSVSSEFARWFWQHTRFSEIEAKVVDVFVSRSDSTGESDLVVLYESVVGRTTCHDSPARTYFWVVPSGAILGSRDLAKEVSLLSASHLGGGIAANL